jgi:8-oxo-dGTP pyrophosphatase MutT (NUDIX family)
MKMRNCICYHEDMKAFGDTEKIEEYGTSHPEATDVEGVVVVGYDPAIDKWLALEWTGKGTIWLVGGGKERGESFEHAAVRELKEETGYSTFQAQVQLGGFIKSHYYNEKKGLHRRSNSLALLFILDSTDVGQQELESHEKFDVVWLGYEELREALGRTGGGVEHWLAVLQRAHDYVKSSV